MILIKCPQCKDGHIKTVFDNKYLYRICDSCEFESEMEYALDENNKQNISFKESCKHEGFKSWAKERGAIVEDG